MRNWAGNVTYSTRRLLTPATVDEVRLIVRAHPRVKALGSRHSFNDSADTTGVQVSLERLPAEIRIDGRRGTVSSSGGLTHSELSSILARDGYALPNLASLPHISVAGAIQTGTHGSGANNPSLAESVVSLDLIDADGQLRTVSRGDADFAGTSVGLGALGIVVAVTQEVVPAFEVEQSVYQRTPWRRLLPKLEAVLGSAYSVSIFTRFDTESVHQIWFKRRVHDSPHFPLQDLGGEEAQQPLHPLPHTPAANVTPQLRNPGPSHERLPHFRSDFKPGRGDEIQSEYLVGIEHAGEAIEAMRSIGHLVAPLLHMAEVRRVAADSAWLSPSFARDSLAIHFTWRSRPEAVLELLPDVESRLLALGARPHWGKVFLADSATLREAYDRLPHFAALVRQKDPDGRFSNAFLGRVLGDEAPETRNVFRQREISAVTTKLEERHHGGHAT